MTNRPFTAFRTTRFLTVATVVIPSTQAQNAAKPSIRVTTHYVLKSDRAGDIRHPVHGRDRHFERTNGPDYRKEQRGNREAPHGAATRSPLVFEVALTEDLRSRAL
jgi:hypothetical protein